MKRCSTCNRLYTDPNLSFCIDDGTPLTTVDSEDDATVVSPRSNGDDDWNAVAYQPPRQYVTPGTEVRRRRAWPWVLGIVGAFILGILAIGILGAVVAPRLMSSAERQRAARSGNQVENSNSGGTTNSNTNSSEHIETPPPTDHQQVLTQLTDMKTSGQSPTSTQTRKNLIGFWLKTLSGRRLTATWKRKPITSVRSSAIRV